MAYAGIQTMLLAYKMQKADKEYELMGITHEKASAVKDSNALNEKRQAELSEISKDDPNYDDLIDAIEDDYNSDLAEITAWEDELEQKESNCNTQISMLDGYINSWQTALQTNVQKSHSYGNR